ncbi:metallophosphoesterase [Massilia violaceinigra]|uniref:Metallophosphoesterase n=1 Tax=Massilia violaceinigra TaxID=2045208 RepID=A0ABY4A5W5_9BURK|nr:metallophosphoesterase [Massilia violaceinigra]UOD30186.1 metallophosphoesterase [Massilia violaceinigra]
MAALCARKGCDFVIYLGDNFYGQGITRPDDPHCQQKFELPYAGLDLPFYAMPGNHDYGDPPLDYWKPQFQIAYTRRPARWLFLEQHG